MALSVKRYFLINGHSRNGCHGVLMLLLIQKSGLIKVFAAVPPLSFYAYRQFINTPTIVNTIPRAMVCSANG